MRGREGSANARMQALALDDEKKTASLCPVVFYSPTFTSSPFFFTVLKFHEKNATAAIT